MLTVFSDDYFMSEALKEAQKAFEKGEVPIGAVIVSNNQIIARAHNQTEQLVDFTAHAEMIAFTAATEYLGKKHLNDCTLYVTVEPCVMCSGAAYWTQLKKLVFATTDPKRGPISRNLDLLHPKCEVVQGIKEEEARSIMQNFFRKKRI